MALHTPAGGGGELLGEGASETVVVNDEKLDPDGFGGLIDGLKNGIEGRRAIDEELHMV